VARRTDGAAGRFGIRRTSRAMIRRSFSELRERITRDPENAARRGAGPLRRPAVKPQHASKVATYMPVGKARPADLSAQKLGNGLRGLRG
jgi:hypothetical protein